MASFTSLGVGSNLPLDTLLTNLTTAEKGRLKPITQQQSSYYVNVASSASLYSYNLATEFRLPTSTGEFGAVGAYGNQTGWLFSTDGSSRGGYRYYVRAQ